MEFGRAFTFVFEDEEWIKKVLLAGVILLIPVIGWLAVGGWLVEIVRRVIAKDPNPLPDWSDFGGYIGKGFQAFVIAFVYELPLLLLQGCLQGAILLVSDPSVGSDETVTTLVTIASLCFGCISLLYGIFMGFVLPAALGNFAAQGSLGAGFRFGEVFGLVKAAPGAYLIVLLGGFVASIVASLGVIACIVGVLFTSAYAYAVVGHLSGQAYLVAKGEPAPVEVIDMPPAE